MTVRLVAIAAPESGLMLDPSAVAREPSVSRETPTAVVEVHGPLVSAADCWWGGVSISALAHRIEELAESGMGILLDFDSPGGDVSGLVELCDAIASARQRVSVNAYVRGLCASAAYWVASQCESIESSPTGIIGQIGAQLVIYDPPAEDEYRGLRVVITSAGSERKNASASADGAQYQALVDNAAAEFVAAVARGRGVGEDVVRGQYGHGALLPAPDALALGMIDAVRGAAGGDGMAKLKAEEMAPETPAPEDKDKMIEELRKQLADQATRIAELESACKPKSEDGEVPDSPAEPMPDPEKEELAAQVAGLSRRLADVEMKAALDVLVASTRLPPARRGEAEKAWKLQRRAAADPSLADYSKAFDEFVAALPSLGARASAVNPAAPTMGERKSIHELALEACAGDKSKYHVELARIIKEGGR